MHTLLRAHKVPRPANKAILVESILGPSGSSFVEGNQPWPPFSTLDNTLPPPACSTSPFFATELSPLTTHASRHVPRCGWCHG